MGDYLLLALDWSEVWSLFIPLFALSIFRKQPASLKPIIIYLFLALFLNLIIDFIIPFKKYFPSWLHSNNPFYNIHSVVRFICFSFYFIHLPQTSFKKLKKWLGIISLVFLLVNFSFFENFFNPKYFSGNLLTIEAYLLLSYCMLYYLSELKDDTKNLFDGPDFWVVTGLSIYVVTNFFVFLFYLPMINVDVELAINIWNVHNIAFIIFCLFITRAFYVSFRYQLTV